MLQMNNVSVMVGENFRSIVFCDVLLKWMCVCRWRVFTNLVTYLSHQIHLEPEWIPRGQNEQADFISRILDFDNWMLDPLMFAELDHEWGPQTIDRFADMYNAQLDILIQGIRTPGSETVDAFTCDWGGEINWLFPPLHLNSRVIQHAKETRAQGSYPDCP